MNAVIIEMADSLVNATMASVSLRAGFLFCERVTSAGDTYYGIYYDEMEKGLKQESKIMVIDDYYDKRPEADRPWPKGYAQQMLKSLAKMKHHSGEGIVMKKKFEKDLERLYSLVTADRKESITATGLPELGKIFTEDNLHVYAIDAGAREKDDGGYCALSKVMMRTTEGADRDLEFFFLPSEFMMIAAREKYPVRFDSRFLLPGEGYFEPLFQIPNLNLLTALELETVKKRLLAVSPPFFEKVNEWMTLVYKNEKIGKTSAFLKKEVFPSASGMLNIVSADEQLKHVSRMQNNNVSGYILMGEMPVEILWQFFRQMKVVQEDTWAILEKAMEDPKYKEKRFPVMTWADKEEKAEAKKGFRLFKKKKQEPEIAPVKKSIDVD